MNRRSVPKSGGGPVHAQASTALQSGSRGWMGLSPTAQIVLAAVVVLGLTFCSTVSMTGLAPSLPAVAAGAFLFVLLLSRNHSLIIHAMLVVLFTTSIPEIPRGIRVGGIFVYFNEFLILGGFVYASWMLRNNPALRLPLRKSFSVRLALLFCIVIVMGISLAILRGYPIWDVQYDVKSVVEMMMVMFISLIVVLKDDWRQYLKTITAILIFSAALMIYASVTGFVLWGRTEAAELYAAGGRAIAGGSDAVRFLTQTTPLALAVLVGCTALLLVGRTRVTHVLPMLIPALVISVLSFSRNTLLALAGAVAFALVIAVVNGHILRIVFRIAMAPLIASVLLFALLTLGGAVGAGDWIDTQTTGYANRVIAGFDQANERADTSANYREQENDYIKKTGAEHPVFGGGFGTHYKPPSGDRDTFPAFEGTLYSHNAYNWFYVKVGIVGVGIFVALIAACAMPAILRRSDNELLTTAAATLVGLSIAIVVTPMPIEQPGSALLGIVLGACVGANARKTSQSAASIDSLALRATQ